jgi:Deoxycytidylate deaminase
MLKDKFRHAYMDTAKRFAELSHCERLKVGAIIVKDDRIISIGYNGMPSGWDNCCECDGHTKPEVLHAEANAITKLAKSTESGDGASLFCTHSPCIDCAKLIVQSGITHVYFSEKYRSNDGLIFLTKSGVLLCQVG